MTGGADNVDAAPDFELVARCRQGDANAWRILVIRYQRLIYSIAYRFTGRFDRAEDVTQEIFLKVYRSLARFEPEKGEFKSWLTTISRNLLIDTLRKEKSGWKPAGDSETLTHLDDTKQVSPLETMERNEKIRFVHRCMTELAPELRQVLVLREIEEMNYEDIAVMIKAPLGTVKSRINRGRVELARIMKIRHLTWFPQGSQGERRGA